MVEEYSEVGGDYAEEKYILMLIYAPNDEGKFGTPLKGNIWLQKEMFLLSQYTDELNDLSFDQHLFGPHSSEDLSS